MHAADRGVDVEAWRLEGLSRAGFGRKVKGGAGNRAGKTPVILAATYLLDD